MDNKQKVSNINENQKRIDLYLTSGIKLYDYGYDSCSIAYQVGLWFVAYLVHSVGEEQIKHFYYGLEQNGFDEAFVKYFGKTYHSYIEEFDKFLTKPKSEILSIITTD